MSEFEIKVALAMPPPDSLERAALAARLIQFRKRYMKGEMVEPETAEWRWEYEPDE